MPEISIRPATAADVRVFAGWRHQAPYDVYDITQPVDDAVEYFLRPATNCHVIEAGGELAGFMTFGTDAQVPGGDYTGAGLDIGLGMKPSLTGRGLGSAFVRSVIGFAREAFEERPLRVTIAALNQRALRVWSGCGFTETQQFTASEAVLGSDRFMVLEDGGA
ncbi:MAG: GNAT family N-acetyltransferase [Acidimicrobiia bacterium]